MPKALVITPGTGTATVHNFETLEDYQKIVGGNLQVVPSKLPGLDFYVNEEGKFDADAQLNLTATALARLFDGDYIAGTAIMIGQPDDEGETTDIDQWLDLSVLQAG